MKMSLSKLLWFLVSTVGCAIKAAVSATTIIYVARYLKVFWL